VTLVVPNAPITIFFGPLPLQEMKFEQFLAELPDPTRRWRRSPANVVRPLTIQSIKAAIELSRSQAPNSFTRTFGVESSAIR
jgi:hypothetical protein